MTNLLRTMHSPSGSTRLKQQKKPILWEIVFNSPTCPPSKRLQTHYYFVPSSGDSCSGFNYI